MARFTETLIFFVFAIIATILSVPVPIDPGSEINITSPRNWQSGTTQVVSWNVGDPSYPVAKPGDTVSVSIWQFGFGLDPQKVADIGTQIPFDDLFTQYVVPTEPEFTNMGLRYNSFNYWVLVEGDQLNQEDPGGSVLRGESGVFQFAPAIDDLVNTPVDSAPPVVPRKDSTLPFLPPKESVSPLEETISILPFLPPKESTLPVSLLKDSNSKRKRTNSQGKDSDSGDTTSPVGGGTTSPPELVHFRCSQTNADLDSAVPCTANNVAPEPTLVPLFPFPSQKPTLTVPPPEQTLFPFPPPGLAP